MSSPRHTHTRPAAAAAPQAGPAGSVRIIGGMWKRTRLPVPALPGLRPTPDRVRETLFNWLPHDLTGWRVLDAFAGTGALGLEAASRGAAQVVLLERDAAALRALRGVQQRLNATQLRIEQADALEWMRRADAACFDLILLDPPFAADLFEPALRACGRLIDGAGRIYLEADRAFTDEQLAPCGLALQRAGRAASVHFHLLAPQATAAGF